MSGCFFAGALLLSFPMPEICRANVLEIPLRGIYVPGWKGVNKSRIDTLRAFLVQNHLNTLMIDLKNAHGELFYRPASALAKRIGAQVTTREGQIRFLDMDYLLQAAKKYNFRLIARHVLFVDSILYRNVPEYRLTRGRKQHWVDMVNQAVVDYNLELLDQEASLGFDEIVLDYVRFPDLPGFGSEKGRSDTIDAIVQSVKAVLKGTKIKLGIQIFGYSAWDHHRSNVGQRIESLQFHTDSIYPMLYPSHFFAGSLGFSNPNRHPFEIIGQGYQAALSKIETDCTIIPMIQGFSYSAEDIRQQILAVQKHHMPGFVSWNPSGDQRRLAQAMKKMQDLAE